MSELNAWRTQIDEIDEQLLTLLHQRFKIAQEIARYKQHHQLPILNQGREMEVLQHVNLATTDASEQKHLSSIYQKIMAETRQSEADKGE